MINYNEGDLHNYPLFKAIIEKLGGDEITERQVWDEARGYLDYPCFENILYELSETHINELIVAKLEDTDIEFKLQFYINAGDTHISVADDEIHDVADFVQAFTVSGGTI